MVTIFSQSDMQVPIGQQFVRLEGEFKASGVYQVQPGESLRHLVARVGGFTPQAYLYGAEFTRQSVREDQQQRLDQYVTDLEKSFERGKLAAQPHPRRSVGGKAVRGRAAAAAGQAAPVKGNSQDRSRAKTELQQSFGFP